MVERVRSARSPALAQAEQDFTESRNTPGPKRGSGDVVTVGCKLPAGLILRVFDMVDTPEPVMGGGTRMSPMARELPQRIELKGYAVPFGQPVNRPIFGRFALTNNVPRDFFELWLHQNKDTEIVKNGLVFMEDSEDAARDHAKEFKTLRSGFEALNTESKDAKGRYTDPRMPARIKKALQTEDAE